MSTAKTNNIKKNSRKDDAISPNISSKSNPKNDNEKTIKSLTSRWNTKDNKTVQEDLTSPEGYQSQNLKRSRAYVSNDFQGSRSVKRNLFGPIDHAKLNRELKSDMELILENKKEKWDFDFLKGNPVEYDEKMIDKQTYVYLNHEKKKTEIWQKSTKRTNTKEKISER
jgi:hypothetical protein